MYSSFSQSKFVCMKEECSCTPVLVRVSLYEGRVQLYSSFSQSVCMREECSCTPVLVRVCLSESGESADVLRLCRS